MLVLFSCGKSTEPQGGSASGMLPPPSTTVWVKRFGDRNVQGIDALALDSAGGVVAGGYACGTVDFGGGPQTVVGNCGLFVARFSPDGLAQWVRVDGVAGIQSSVNVAYVLPTGNVLVAGHLGRAMFVDELDSNGAVVTKLRHGDPMGGDGYASVRALTMIGADRVVAGDASKRVDLGMGTIEHIGVFPFVARYSPDGTARWVQVLDAKYKAGADAIATLPDGNVAVCGETDAPEFGAFVTVLDGSTGQPRWSKLDGDSCNALAVLGDTLVAGGVVSSGTIVAAYSSTGELRWKLPSSNGFVPTALSVVDDQLLIVGRALGDEHQLLRLDRVGKVLASKTMSGKFELHAMAANNDGIVVGGQLEGHTDLGTGTDVATVKAPADAPTNLDALLGRIRM